MNFIYAIMGEDDDGNYGIIAVDMRGEVFPCVSRKIELINELMDHLVKGKAGSRKTFEIIRYTKDMVIQRVVT